MKYCWFEITAAMLLSSHSCYRSYPSKFNKFNIHVMGTELTKNSFPYLSCHDTGYPAPQKYTQQSFALN